MTTDVMTAPAARSGEGRWLAADPDKAWGEKFFLLYSPIWMAAFGIYQRSRVVDRFGDFGNLLLTLALFLPVWLVPPLLHDGAVLGRRWWETYWFKFNVWILIYSAIGSYFFSEYFFDVMGMVYHYPTLHWTFDSALLGSGTQAVPIIMYLHAHYFFLTYHTTAVAVMRRVRTSPLGKLPLARVLVVAVTAWFWAWAEIRFTTAPSIADQFRYQNLAWALRWGALFYACFFVVSFPTVYCLDEDPDQRWSLGHTVTSALAAAMLTFILLDLATKCVGAPYRG